VELWAPPHHDVSYRPRLRSERANPVPALQGHRRCASQAVTLDFKAARSIPYKARPRRYYSFRPSTSCRCVSLSIAVRSALHTLIRD